MFKLKFADLWNTPKQNNGFVAQPLDAEDETAEAAPLPAAPDPPKMVTLVERDAELAKLKSYWQDALEGHGRVVLVCGEAGLGKSTLAATLINSIGASGKTIKIARAVCSAQSGRDEPFWPFADVMSQLVTSSKKKITDDVMDAFLEFAPSWVSIIPVAGPVVGASLKTAQVVRTRTKTSDAPNPEKLLREYVGALKKVSAKQPALIFVDDLHWSDAGSIKLLSHLSRAVRDLRVLIVGAYRPSDIAVEDHPLRGLIAELLRYDRDAQLVLAPLTPAGVVQLVKHIYPANKFPDGFCGDLARTTGGAPLFVVESLHLMQDRGEIKKDEKDGRWMLTRELNDDDLPRNVEAIIGKRLERIPEDLREILAMAAVQGVSFQTAVLAGVVGKDELEVMRALQPAEKDHVVIEYVGDVDLGQDVTSEYRFTNNLFQRALLEALRGKKRLLAFRKTAEALDNLWPDDSEDIAPRLANLYEHGKVFDSAARFMLIAGHYARQSGSITRAIELYENAEKALGRAHADDGEDELLHSNMRQQIDEALSYLYEVDSSYEKSESRTRRALTRGLDALGWRRYASLRMRMASLMVRRGRYTEALDTLQSLRSSLNDLHAEESQSYEAFQLSAELCKTLVILNRDEEAIKTAQDALAELENLPERDWRKAARARLNTSLALAYHADGDYRRAIKLSEDTLQTVRELNMVSTAGALLSNLVQLYVEVGDYERVPENIKLMEEMAADTSNEYLLASANLSEGMMYVLQGKNALALDKLDKATEFADMIKLFDERPKILVMQIFALVELGRTAEAREVLDKAMPLAVESGSREWMAYAQAAKARVLLAEGNPREAQMTAREGAGTLRDDGTHFDEAIARRVLARCHAALGQKDDAAQALERARTLFKLIGNVPLTLQVDDIARALGVS
ncbi:MAG TPA: AAA family ATPase [Thermoflexales bacterium]|nr:AAA family ATPase [Thermoflexales bacterium]HQW34849.1 AAA family ATPase [Thermoflexales bacterium]HQZ22332.1 AAA family ATPase [Thermoflexales bacterium]HRA00748.1 AAA family ATPase [Thermoflexales bacterium]